MNVQGLGGLQQVAQTMTASAGKPTQGASPAEMSKVASSIQNDQGQSLVDIRDELQSAVKDAVQNHDGSGDLRSTIEGAINSTLEANGFDPSEVKGAMQDAGFSPADRLGAAGFDPASMLQNGSSEQDVIQSFLEQFRSGSNLDLEI